MRRVKAIMMLNKSSLGWLPFQAQPQACSTFNSTGDGPVLRHTCCFCSFNTFQCPQVLIHVTEDIKYCEVSFFGAVSCLSFPHAVFSMRSARACTSSLRSWNFTDVHILRLVAQYVGGQQSKVSAMAVKGLIMASKTACQTAMSNFSTVAHLIQHIHYAALNEVWLKKSMIEESQH